ncbi:hypothetical protein Z043_117023 [Scleropages formosus]|uniref:Uncharacterized protein n=1 Tax=Scleropages formosus TaxID=113540 RepID=A0A0P7WLL7_SCLFO|nr:hypothetical protein Z043_117023 [Scleropages formosus]
MDLRGTPACFERPAQLFLRNFSEALVSGDDPTPGRGSGERPGGRCPPGVNFSVFPGSFRWTFLTAVPPLPPDVPNASVGGKVVLLLSENGKEPETRELSMGCHALAATGAPLSCSLLLHTENKSQVSMRLIGRRALKFPRRKEQNKNETEQSVRLWLRVEVLLFTGYSRALVEPSSAFREVWAAQPCEFDERRASGKEGDREASGPVRSPDRRRRSHTS